MSFYMVFVPRKGSLHQPSMAVSGVAVLHIYCHPLYISMIVHHSMLHSHSCSTNAVIPVSVNMQLVLIAVTPPPFWDPLGKKQNYNLNILTIFTNKVCL